MSLLSPQLRHGIKYGIIGDNIHSSCLDRPSLRPYIECEGAFCPIKYSFWQKYILGGVPSVVWPYIVLTVVIVTIWNILWITEILPPAISPISEFWVDNTVFLISFILVNLFNRGDDRYKKALTDWTKSKNALLMHANVFTSLFVPQKFDIIRKNKTLQAAIYRMMHYNRAAVYAAVDDLREGSYPHCMTLPHDLKNEMEQRCDTTEYQIDGLAHMMLEQLPRLQDVLAGTGPAQAVSDIRSFMDNLKSIKMLRKIQSPSAYKIHTAVILITYFVFLFQYLFDLYNWFGIAVAIYLVYAMIGLVLIAFRVDNPFEPPHKNFFLYEIDIVGDAHRIARESDLMFQHLLNRVGIKVNWDKDGCFIVCNDWKPESFDVMCGPGCSTGYG